MECKKSKKLSVIVTVCFSMLFFLGYSSVGFISQVEDENTISPDSYEDDDTYSKANVIEIRGDKPQQHNFHDAGDEDWVKFYGVADKGYNIEVQNPGTACNPVIELYDADGTTLINSMDLWDEGEDELLTWLCHNDGVYYVKVKNFDPNVFGEGTEYELLVYGDAAGTGMIIGMITDRVSGEAIDGALVKTDVGASTISVEGYYILLVLAGEHTIQVQASGYVQVSVPTVTVEEGGSVTQDILMEPSSPSGPCIVEEIYGQHSLETEALRGFRDDVLSKTPQGQKLIKQYYKWSPELVQVIAENERVKMIMKTFIDGMLPLIESQTE